MRGLDVFIALGGLTLSSLALTACGSAHGSSSDSTSAGSTASTTSTASSGATSSSGTATSSSSGGATSSSTGAPFNEQAHTPFPLVTENDPSHPPHLLVNPQVVTLTYDSDPNQATLETYADWIVTSDWITTVGADYGVGTGTHVSSIHLPGPPPSTLSDDEVQTLIQSQIASGAAPAPSSLTDPLYMIFIDPTTQQFSDSGTGCEEYGGYHGAMVMGSANVSYAVVLDCPSFNGGGLQEEEITVSHELMEAATDPQVPFLITYAIEDSTNPWFYVGAEVGDLCWGQSLTEGIDTVQRIWSISAAAAGVDPCLPSDSSKPYFNVSVEPSGLILAKAGSTVTLEVTGWSTAPTDPWVLTAVARDGFGMLPQLSDYEIRNGVTLTLTLTIPANLQLQSQADLWLQSSLDGLHQHIWPIAVFITQ